MTETFTFAANSFFALLYSSTALCRRDRRLSNLCRERQSERERERERDRQTDRQTDNQRERHINKGFVSEKNHAQF